MIDQHAMVVLLGSVGRSGNTMVVEVNNVRYPVVGVKTVEGETVIEVGEGREDRGGE